MLKDLSHPAGNGYPALFRAGGCEGNGEEKWRPISVTPSPLQVGSQRHFPTWPLAKGQTLPFC